MSTTPANDQENPDREDAREAKAMNDQLRKDVASWSATRPEDQARQAADFSAPAVKPPTPPTAPKAKRSKPAAPEAAPAPARNKPFSMSYGGVTNAEHIANMIARGAR
jgi:hypothetical protein